MGRLQWPVQDGAAVPVAGTKTTRIGMMASPERHHENGSSDDDEEYDNPAEHLEIERRRFAGGLQPTPELYALAREQWYRLPGVLARPSMDPVIGEPASGDTQPPGQAHPDEKEPGQ
jgi:hypothetical protein